MEDSTFLGSSEGLIEQKTPILEPSTECSDCQYYERCFMKKKNTKQLDLAEMLGFGDKKD